MTPIHLLEASGAPAFTLQQGGWITVNRRFFLKEQLGACGLHNSVKLGPCSPELKFSLFCNIWGSGLDRNRTFFVKYALKRHALYALARENGEALASVIEFLS